MNMGWMKQTHPNPNLDHTFEQPEFRVFRMRYWWLCFLTFQAQHLIVLKEDAESRIRREEPDARLGRQNPRILRNETALLCCCEKATVFPPFFWKKHAFWLGPPLLKIRQLTLVAHICHRWWARDPNLGSCAVKCNLQSEHPDSLDSRKNIHTFPWNKCWLSSRPWKGWSCQEWPALMILAMWPHEKSLEIEIANYVVYVVC